MSTKNKPNWEHAPTWANVLLQDIKQNGYAFAEDFEEGADAITLQDVFSGDDYCFALITGHWKVIEHRPTLVQKAWADHALPPIGTVCEYADNDANDETPISVWESGDQLEILAHKNVSGIEVAVCWNITKQEADMRVATYGGKNLFRPLATEEDRVVEEMSRIFHSNCSVDYSGAPFMDGLRALYKAGFVKGQPK